MSKIDPQEFFGTINGFDEIAIEKAFRGDLSELSATRTLRAAEFVRLRRESFKDVDAYQAAMSATLAELNDRWGEPEDEPFEIEGDDPKASTSDS